MSDIKMREGIVLVMDALGSKGIWKKVDPVEYISLMKSFETEIDKTVKPIFESFNDYETIKEHMLEESQFQMITFSDTMIITYLFPKLKFELPNNQLFGSLLLAFQAFSDDLMINALKRKIFYRGSISFGQIIKDDTHILGPAIDDAAYYYDKANWIGLSCTPSTTLAIQGLVCDIKPNFLSYPVPFKEGKKYELCCSNWPLAYKKIWDADKKDPVREIKTLFSRNIIPDDAISKYYNTIEFFEYSIAHSKPKE